MEAKQVKEYKKYGYHFAGKLVVVDYSEDMKADPREGKIGIALAYEYRGKAMQTVINAGFEVEKILTTFPDLVVRVKR